jgi:hypothetical protein
MQDEIVLMFNVDDSEEAAGFWGPIRDAVANLKVLEFR